MGWDDHDPWAFGLNVIHEITILVEFDRKTALRKCECRFA